MTKAPKIPREQRSFAGDKADVSGGRSDRRDARTDVHDGQPGDAGSTPRSRAGSGISNRTRPTRAISRTAEMARDGQVPGRVPGRGETRTEAAPPALRFGPLRGGPMIQWKVEERRS